VATADVVRELSSALDDATRLANPTAAKVWAAIESVALNEDDEGLRAARARSNALLRPAVPSAAKALDALDALCGTQDDVDAANKKPRIDRDVLPDDLLTNDALANHGGVAAWKAVVGVYTRRALRGAADKLQLPITKSITKQPLLDKIADHLERRSQGGSMSDD